MDATDEVYLILRDAKVLARRYYHLTGKPLGVTGEVAEYEAARISNWSSPGKPVMTQRKQGTG